MIQYSIQYQGRKDNSQIAQPKAPVTLNLIVVNTRKYIIQEPLEVICPLEIPQDIAQAALLLLVRLCEAKLGHHYVGDAGEQLRGDDFEEAAHTKGRVEEP